MAHMKHRSLVWRVAALTLTAMVSAQAAPAWHALESGRWTLLTDMNPRDGTRVLRQLQEMAAIFGSLTKQLPDSARPIRVILFRAEVDFRPFQHGSANKGLYFSGSERDYVMLLDSGDETLRAARHEVVHMLLHHSSTPLPPWLEEGLAEYFSTVRYRAGKVALGQAIPSHVELLGTTDWLPAAQLMAWRDDGPTTPANPGGVLVYAEGWAVTQLLMTQPDASARLERFGDLLRNGVAQPVAIEQAFARSLEQVLDDARQAVNAKRFRTRELTIGNVPEPPPSAQRSLTEVEARLMRADALLARGHGADAERLIAETARKYPNLPSAIAGLGYLAMSKRDFGSARQYLERALAMGDRQATTYYQLAMLVNDAQPDAEQVVELLRQAVAVNPSFAEAWYLLGSVELRLRRPAEATEAMRHATDAQPRHSMYWEGLGRAQRAAGQVAAARSAAQTAVATATTPEQSAMARGLLRELDQTPKPASDGKKNSVVVPKTWEQRQGDASVNGKLVRVDCSGSHLKFHIQTKPATAKSRAQVTILFSDKPNEIMLRGNSKEKREFVCGYQRIAPLVEAFYVTTPATPPVKPKPGQRPAPMPPAGELVILDFK